MRVSDLRACNVSWAEIFDAAIAQPEAGELRCPKMSKKYTVIFDAAVAQPEECENKQPTYSGIKGNTLFHEQDTFASFNAFL